MCQVQMVDKEDNGSKPYWKKTKAICWRSNVFYHSEFESHEELNPEYTLE